VGTSGAPVSIQAPLGPAADAFDDASPENMALLENQARALIAERTDDLDRVCGALSDPGSTGAETAPPAAQRV
jgi:hypothetical protein